jgi:polyhydroxyalkanoate synthesis regulator phasin
MSELRECPVCGERLVLFCDVDKHPNDMYGFTACEHINIRNHASEEDAVKALDQVLVEYAEWKSPTESRLRDEIKELNRLLDVTDDAFNSANSDAESLAEEVNELRERVRELEEWIGNIHHTCTHHPHLQCMGCEGQKLLAGKGE